MNAVLPADPERRTVTLKLRNFVVVLSTAFDSRAEPFVKPVLDIVITVRAPKDSACAETVTIVDPPAAPATHHG